jgi:hypothetical protein
MLIKIFLTIIISISLYATEFIITNDQLDNIEIEKIIEDNFDTTNMSSNEIYNNYKYMENLLAADILYKDLELAKKDKRIFYLNDLKLKYSLLFKHLKTKLKINENTYKEFFKNNNLEVNKTYNISYFKLRDFKTATIIIDILSKKHSYQEIKIIYNDFSSILKLDKSEVFLEYIETKELRHSIRKELSNKSNEFFIKKPIRIGQYYYIVIILNKNSSFNFNDFNDKIKNNSVYRNYINNKIVHEYLINKINKVKQLHNIKIREIDEPKNRY